MQYRYRSDLERPHVAGKSPCRQQLSTAYYSHMQFMKAVLLWSIYCLQTFSTAAFTPVTKRHFSGNHTPFLQWRKYTNRFLVTNSAEDTKTSTTNAQSKNAAPVNEGGITRKKIQSVPWTGSRGMLPLQRYSGILPNFDEWLIQPFPSEKNNNQTAEIDSAAELSKSSLHLLERQESLSEWELRNLHKKIAAEARASMPLNPFDHLRPIYIDESIVVVDKPGGVLCVPGIRRNPSVANIVHTYIGGSPGEDVDKMVVHRLDGATSGVVVFARTLQALQKLHLDFRDRNVKKTYEALLCGHLHSQEGEIDLPLERDRNRPPFMRVATTSVYHTDGDDGSNNSFQEDASSPNLNKHDGYKKMMSKKPKESFSTFRVISYEYFEGCPVTRVELVPFTGRTHQLRVHMAAIGHAIVGDGIYGFMGEGSPNGGFSDTAMDEIMPHRASLEVQQRIDSILSRQRGNPNRPSVSNDGAGEGTLCLHARQLCLFHPKTTAPIIFESPAPF